MRKNFAITGVAGFVAPRHLRAIQETGNRLVAAADPHDAVGVLDSYSFDVRFFTEIERFDRHLEKLRRGPDAERVHFVSICSPNYLHDAHVRLALRAGADAICEKPLVISPWNLDALQEIERETGHRVYSVLQLRLHPALIALRDRLAAAGSARHEVELTYVTARGRWYDVSWKGSEERSGGLVLNIGIHFFDLLLWLFGPVLETAVYERTPRHAVGRLDFERATVRWLLSSEPAHLLAVTGGTRAGSFRRMRVDGSEVQFTDGFVDLHTRVYEEVLAGRGAGIDEARPAIELAHRIRHQTVTPATAAAGSPLSVLIP
ncbi:MAG: Gfo/Idh/MocA family protein [Vicinamibacterales bacterium]